MNMTPNEAIKDLEDLKNHSCEIEGADFGWYSCCNQRNYQGHKTDCKQAQALNLAISALSQVEKMRAALEKILYYSVAGSGKTYSDINWIAKQALEEK